MFQNHLYNLMNQLVEEHKSLWRIRNMYLKDSEGYEDCRMFWEKLATDKEAHVRELRELIRKYLAEED